MPSAWSSDVCSRSEEHTSELQSHDNLVCRLLLEKNKVEGITGQGRIVPRTLARRDSRSFRLRHIPAEQVQQSWLDVIVFFNDTATTEIYTLALHDALPI